MVERKNYSFRCRWCGFEFIKEVGGYVGGTSLTGHEERKSNLSDQVKCPVCGNFLKNSSGREV